MRNTACGGRDDHASGHVECRCLKWLYDEIDGTNDDDWGFMANCNNVADIDLDRECEDDRVLDGKDDGGNIDDDGNGDDDDGKDDDNGHGDDDDDGKDDGHGDDDVDGKDDDDDGQGDVSPYQAVEAGGSRGKSKGD